RSPNRPRKAWLNRSGRKADLGDGGVSATAPASRPWGRNPPALKGMIADAADALWPPVLVLHLEGAGRALRERDPVHVPQVRARRPGGGGGVGGAVADQALPRAGRRGADPAGDQRDHRAPGPEPPRPHAAAAAGPAGRAGGPVHGPGVRHLRDDADADLGLQRRAADRPARRLRRRTGEGGAVERLRLAEPVGGRADVGGGGGLLYGRLRRRAGAAVRPLGAPDPRRAGGAAPLSSPPVRSALRRPRGGRRAALSRRLPVPH